MKYKAKAISAKLLELNSKNKLVETGAKQEETGRNRKKRGETEKTGQISVKTVIRPSN